MIRSDLIYEFIFGCGILGLIGIVFGVYQEDVNLAFVSGVTGFTSLVILSIWGSLDKDRIRHIFYDSRTLQSSASVSDEQQSRTSVTQRRES